MISLGRNRLRLVFSSSSFHPTGGNWGVNSGHLVATSTPLDNSHCLKETQITPSSRIKGYDGLSDPFRGLLGRCFCTKRMSSAYRKRVNKRLRALSKPVLDEARFREAIAKLPARFSNDELFNVMTLEDDPLVCLELFSWAGQDPRFRHDTSTFHVTIKKLGVAKMYQEMDDVVNQVLALPHIGNEAMYNTVVYFFTEARKLTRAVNIFKHMRSCRNLDCRPSIKTYNILFTAMLSRGKNSYVNHVYMETISCLFRQMVSDGIEPDIYSLNSMIKGYVLSLHVNDALRIFHQMGVIYSCLPNSFSYDYLIHGLCAHGRTNNARELCDEMKRKGFVPSSKSYNSLVNALALSGDVNEAASWLWEMVENHKCIDYITYRTLLDEMCRKRRGEDAMRLLKQLQESNLVDGMTYRRLLCVLEGDIGVIFSEAPRGLLMLLQSISSTVITTKHLCDLRYYHPQWKRHGIEDLSTVRLCSLAVAAA